MIENWLLASTNLHRVREQSYEVAVLPIGATEPHNLHLPYGQDYLQVEAVAHRCCKAAWEQCPAVVCLPTIPYGVDANMLDVPMAMHVSQAVLDAMVEQLVRSLVHHGIHKVVLLNGHGGNDFKPFIRQVQNDLDVHLFLCNWWTVAEDHYEELFGDAGDHGGKFETSAALATHPDWIEMENAGDGKSKPFRFNALQKGWLWTSRNFATINDHCGTGNPAGASAESGRKFLDITCRRLTDFLVALAKSTIDEAFPLG